MRQGVAIQRFCPGIGPFSCQIRSSSNARPSSLAFPSASRFASPKRRLASSIFPRRAARLPRSNAASEGRNPIQRGQTRFGLRVVVQPDQRPVANRVQPAQPVGIPGLRSGRRPCPTFPRPWTFAGCLVLFELYQNVRSWRLVPRYVRARAAVGLDEIERNVSPPGEVSTKVSVDGSCLSHRTDRPPADRRLSTRAANSGTRRGRRRPR